MARSPSARGPGRALVGRARVGADVSAPEELEVAVRALAIPNYLSHAPSRTKRSSYEDRGPSEWKLIFDIETTTDPGQGLRVGAYQVRHPKHPIREGLFYSPRRITDAELRL